MKAVVVKINQKQAVNIKSSGAFLSIPNKNYKIGQEIYVKDSSNQGFVKLARIAAAAAVFFAMIGSGAVYAYSTPQSYVSINIDSCVELEVNMFNYVIGASGANEDGTAVLEKVEIANKSLDKAIELIISQANSNGSLTYAEQTVVVGVHSVNPNTEQKVMESTKELICESLEELQISTPVTVINAEVEIIETNKDQKTDSEKENSQEEKLHNKAPNYTLPDFTDTSNDSSTEKTNGKSGDVSNPSSASSSEPKANNGSSEIKTNNGKGTVPKATSASDNEKDKNDKDDKTNNGKGNIDD